MNRMEHRRRLLGGIILFFLLLGAIDFLEWCVRFFVSDPPFNHSSAVFFSAAFAGARAMLGHNLPSFGTGS